MMSSYSSRHQRSSYRLDYELDEETNNDRWLVSYADFMTLLMAFFVVMYSISQVSEQKYRVLSQTLTEAFNPVSEEKRVIEEGEPQFSYTATPIDLDGHALEDRPGVDTDQLPAQFVTITEELEQSFESLIEDELIAVSGDERWLQIELSSEILFNSGGAQLSEPAEAIIGQLTGALEAHKNVVRVEGFTDNVPIETVTFASNWELSAARATAVVRLMESQGIASSRLAAVGYGEHQPAVSNSTAEGRTKNRRIVLMVSTSEKLRPDAEQIEELVISEVEDDGAIVKGLTQTARSQALAWFERLSLSSEQPKAKVITLGDPENTNSASTDGGADAQPISAADVPSVAEGIQQLELENGALLFTR